MNSILKKLVENTKEDFQIGDLSGFRETFDDLDKYNPNNRINDLTLKDWLRHTNTTHIFNTKLVIDQFKIQHPATFEEEFAYYYIEFFSKKGDLILDPFMGSGTTNIVANLMDRFCIGIELNPFFIDLAKKRFKLYQINENMSIILKGDCRRILNSMEFSDQIKKFKHEIQLTITSPPYTKMLKDYSKKTKDRSNLMSNYGELIGNLENIEDYNEFLNELTRIFKLIYSYTKNFGFLVINVQNFHIKKQLKNGKMGREIKFFAWDLVNKIIETKWWPCSEQIWIHPHRKLFPFGYPYVYISNINHNYILIFQKNTDNK